MKSGTLTVKFKFESPPLKKDADSAAIFPPTLKFMVAPGAGQPSVIFPASTLYPPLDVEVVPYVVPLDTASTSIPSAAAIPFWLTVP